MNQLSAAQELAKNQYNDFLMKRVDRINAIFEKIETIKSADIHASASLVSGLISSLRGGQNVFNQEKPQNLPAFNDMLNVTFTHIDTLLGRVEGSIERYESLVVQPPPVSE